MTKKDYVLIAEAISRALNEAATGPQRNADQGVWEAANAIAFALRRDNARFERGKFMDACGLGAST